MADGVDVGAFVGMLDYPMYVVTTAADGRRSGCLVGFGTQTSIDPPRYLVCLSRANATARVAAAATHLAVHLLGPDQHGLAALFGEESGDWTDKFTDIACRPGPGDVPLIDGCPSTLVGAVVGRLALGDHDGYLLEPVEVLGRTDGDVLSFQQVRDMESGHPA